MREYFSLPWAGVKIFLDYENKYLISLVELNSTLYDTENKMVRVAETKSRSQANQFLNGSYISSETIIPTTEKVSKKNSSTVQDVSDIIKETSMGFVNSMELIASFYSEIDSNQKVFIYIKTLDKLKKGRK
jgi:argonaute-like protein implicated in RNA metabolism and viral defense